jgi:hypothetical protein
MRVEVSDLPQAILQVDEAVFQASADVSDNLLEGSLAKGRGAHS